MLIIFSCSVLGQANAVPIVFSTAARPAPSRASGGLLLGMRTHLTMDVKAGKLEVDVLSP